MSEKPKTSRRAPIKVTLGDEPANTKGIMLRYRDADTPYGVTRETVIRLSYSLGLTETEVIHAALALFAQQNLPQFEFDDNPLTAEQKESILKMQPSGRMTCKERLF